LSAHGRKEAAAVARALADTSFERIVSSDLSRAFETARAIADGRGLAIERDVRLREIAFGAWEGLTWAEILERTPEMADVHWTDSSSYVPEGGEGFPTVVARVRVVLDEVLVRPEERVLLVAHAGTIHAALHAMFGEGSPSKGVRLLPASITRVTTGAEGPAVVTLNDASHL